MGNIISNILITIIGDWHILLSIIGAGYWFSRQTKKVLHKEIEGVNARIDKHEIILNNIKDRVTRIEAEVRLEKRVSKLEGKLEEIQPPAT